MTMHVTIIGAGLGGLCLAQGLRKLGISFDVFEKDVAIYSRAQGYRIRLNETGQLALEHCLSPQHYALFLKTCAIAIPPVKTLDTQLRSLEDRWVDDWQDAKRKTRSDLRVDRGMMRTVLMQGIEEKVHFGKQFSVYQDGEDQRLSVCFDDGEQIKTDLLVAADGVYSRVCQQRFPTHQIRDTGYMCAYGKVVLDAHSRRVIAALLRDGTSVVFEKNIAFVVDCMEFEKSSEIGAIAMPQDYVYWALIAASSTFGLESHADLPLSLPHLRQQLNRATQTWSTEVQQLFALSADADMTLTPVKAALAPAPWRSSAICALGDAMHVMSPASGLGANSALYDAQELMSALRSYPTNNLLQCVAEFEEKMRAHSFSAVQSSNAGTRQLLQVGEEECS